MADIIITLILTAALLCVGALYARTLTLDSIRQAAYEAMLVAEANFLHGENDEKLSYVCQTARLALEAAPVPTLIKTLGLMCITEANLRKIIDLWFKQVKKLVQQVPTDEELDAIVKGGKDT